MAAGRNPKSPRKGKKKPSGGGRRKGFLATYRVELFLGGIVGLLAFLLLLLISGGGENKTASTERRASRTDTAPPVKESVPVKRAAPQYEEHLPDSSSSAPASTVPVAPVKRAVGAFAHGPKVAIIIDDLGADMNAARRLAAIGYPITFSILPYLPHTGETARLAATSGRETMLHLPMEPTSPDAHPGDGALLTAMSDDEIRSAYAKAAAAVPHVAGVNNHMGSKFTEDEGKMQTVMALIAQQGIYFIDSRTTSKTVAADVARMYGTPVASRDVFLDNERDVAKIRENVRGLALTARRFGEAVGIGHPYPETVAALAATMPELADEGIVFVYASALARRGDE